MMGIHCVSVLPLITHDDARSLQSLSVVSAMPGEVESTASSVLATEIIVPFQPK